MSDPGSRGVGAAFVSTGQLPPAVKIRRLVAQAHDEVRLADEAGQHIGASATGLPCNATEAVGHAAGGAAGAPPSPRRGRRFQAHPEPCPHMLNTIWLIVTALAFSYVSPLLAVAMAYAGVRMTRVGTTDGDRK